ncbi:unannotated protein [freshwater metagenome]|jgi:hypothetical protein|uniref:Unannotated protein n=1 Tax=freshwater metagenome TaxID=449393 RepID=A0A6J6EB11_9ZZZZ
MAEIDITVKDVGGSQRQDVTVPDDEPSVRIIAAIVDELNLPLNSPDGTPMSYKFHHEETGRQIRDEVTLSDAGVSDGDNLRLIPEIVAG